jgi:uncharacterized repeat protein (TIGR01451 family)/CSLREA domain-containing protein
VLLGVALFATSSASAATTWHVTKTDDSDHLMCAPGDCSLREAIEAANLDSGDTVMVPAGDYQLTIDQLTVNKPMTIVGAGSGPGGTTIHAPATRRVLAITAGAVTITGVTITGGNVSGAQPFGGGIEKTGGSLVLRDSAVTGNTASSETAGPHGAGIDNTAGDLTIENSVIADNHATSTALSTNGGGIFDDKLTGKLVIAHSRVTGNTSSHGGGGGIQTGVEPKISDSEFDDNSVGGVGGGLFVADGGEGTISGSTFFHNSAVLPSGGSGDGAGIFTDAPLQITNTTISRNTASGPVSAGGGVFNNDLVDLTNVTLDGNSAADGGANIWNNDDVTAINSIITGAQPGGSSNCKMPVTTSNGHNIESANDCGFTDGTDRRNTNPKLSPIGNHGGPTLTELPAVDSPAVNAGLNGFCPATDQRGVPRPQDLVCDIGATELTFSTDLGVSVSVSPAIARLSQRPVYTVTVANGGPDTATGVTLASVLPPGATLASAPPACGGNLVCALGSLVPGATATVTIALKASHAEMLPLAFRVSGSRFDSNPANNSASASAIAGPAALSKLSLRPHKLGRGSARIRFTLSRAAKVRLVVQRKVGRHYRTVRHSTRELSGKKGANSTRFSASIRHTRLRPGSYRIQLTAHDAGGTAKPRSAGFRIVGS